MSSGMDRMEFSAAEHVFRASINSNRGYNDLARSINDNTATHPSLASRYFLPLILSRIYNVY